MQKTSNTVSRSTLSLKGLHIHACMYVCMYACMHACMCTCMHACVHAAAANRKEAFELKDFIQTAHVVAYSLLHVPNKPSGGRLLQLQLLRLFTKDAAKVFGWEWKQIYLFSACCLIHQEKEKHN